MKTFLTHLNETFLAEIDFPKTPPPPSPGDDFSDPSKRIKFNGKLNGVKPQPETRPLRGKGSIAKGDLGFTKTDIEYLMKKEAEFEAKKKLKDAMDKLDAQRSASPYHREPGTPKKSYFTPEEEDILKQINKDIESAKPVADVEIETTKAARADITPEDLKKAATRTPEIYPGYEDDVRAFRSSRTTTPKPPSAWQRTKEIGSTILKHPVTRGALKGLAIAGTAYEAGSVGKQIHDVGGLSRHTEKPDPNLARQGYEELRQKRGRLELKLPDTFSGYENVPYAEKRKRQKELAANIRAWEETPTEPKVTREISPSTIEKFRTDPELQRELSRNIGAGPYSNEEILRQIQKRTRAPVKQTSEEKTPSFWMPNNWEGRPWIERPGQKNK